MRVYNFRHKDCTYIVVAETLDEAIKSWRLFTIDISANEEPENTSILHEDVIACSETVLSRQYDECSRELTMLKAKSRQQHSSDEHQIKRLEAAHEERTKQRNDLQEVAADRMSTLIDIDTICTAEKGSASKRLARIAAIAQKAVQSTNS